MFTRNEMRPWELLNPNAIRTQTLVQWARRGPRFPGDAPRLAWDNRRGEQKRFRAESIQPLPVVPHGRLYQASAISALLAVLGSPSLR